MRLASSDPLDEPVVDLNYLAHAHDMALFRKAIRFTRRLKDAIAARGYRIADYIVPDSDADADVDAFIRRTCQTSYHYSSTCRMAPEDDADGGGVVDDELRVYGVENLRVADTSILPRVLGTHLQAPAVAIGEKCADMILKGKRQ